VRNLIRIKEHLGRGNNYETDAVRRGVEFSVPLELVVVRRRGDQHARNNWGSFN
jgi:hypothetical protein